MWVWSLVEELRSHMLHVMAKKLKFKKKMKEKKGLQVSLGKVISPQKGCFPALRSVHIWRPVLCSGLQATDTFGVWPEPNAAGPPRCFSHLPCTPRLSSSLQDGSLHLLKPQGWLAALTTSATPLLSQQPQGKPVLTAAVLLCLLSLLFSFRFIPNYIPLNLWLASF